MPAGIERHAALVAALIDAGELAQGLADAQFADLGHDARSDLTDAVMALMMGIAGCVRESWRSGFARLGGLPEAAIRSLTALPLPDAITTKTAEGFSLYSLYPETYLEAAGMMDAGTATDASDRLAQRRSALGRHRGGRLGRAERRDPSPDRPSVLPGGQTGGSAGRRNPGRQKRPLRRRGRRPRHVRQFVRRGCGLPGEWRGCARPHPLLPQPLGNAGRLLQRPSSPALADRLPATSWISATC